jgi:hypothetical protein
VRIRSERAVGGPLDCGSAAGHGTPPRHDALDLGLQRERQERPDQHDQPEDQNVGQGRRYGHGPDQIRGHQDFQSEQQRAAERQPHRGVRMSRTRAAPRDNREDDGPYDADDEHGRTEGLEALGHVFHHRGEVGAHTGLAGGGQHRHSPVRCCGITAVVPGHGRR